MINQVTIFNELVPQRISPNALPVTRAFHKSVI